MGLGDEFKGLPMDQLIGGPLEAACKANLQLAQGTAQFIRDVGFNTDGKTIRTAEFAYKNGDTQVDINVPLLAIVNIPSLKIQSVDIVFDMEVKTSDTSKSSSSKEAKLAIEAKGGWGPFSVKASLSGSVASHKENTRSTDKSAKYHVEVKAIDTGMPEGLARVLDIMNKTIVPPSTDKVIEKKVKS